ncbi:MAG: hypothetical protein IPQ13_08065 [Holophagaceae bacterium]|nr:hypothetical protein [Holophagaceae bacterium]
MIRFQLHLPPPAPIGPPTNVAASGGQIPGFSEGSLGIKITWDPSPDNVIYYEIQHTWPGQIQPIIIVVYSSELRERWISLGPELIQTSIQVRAWKNGIYSTWSSPVYHKAGPNPPRLEIPILEIDNSVPIKIDRTSQMAETIIIERAEGTPESHSSWEVIKTIDYLGNPLLNTFDAEVKELQNYVYRARNQSQGLVGGYSQIIFASTGVFIPDHFKAEQVNSGVRISWINRSKIYTALELFRADDFSPSGSPVGEVLVSSMDANTTEGFDNSIIQSGFYIYYLRLITPQTRWYGSVSSVRFLGVDSFLENTSMTLPQVFTGFPGGRPNGPTYTMTAYDYSLTINKIGFDQTPEHVINPVSGAPHPGIWVDLSENPHLLYLKPNGPPGGAPSQTFIHTWMENEIWKDETIGELPVNIPFNWDVYSHVALGPGNPLAFTVDHINLLGFQPYNEDTRKFYWKENGTWKPVEYKFLFHVDTSSGLSEGHVFLSYTVTKDGTWFVAYAGTGNNLILFQSTDHGSTWSRRDFDVPIDYSNRPVIHVHIISTDHLFIFRERLSAPPRPSLEWNAQQVINGLGGPEEHVLFSNSTGHGVTIRSRFNATTNTLAILADPSTGLTVGIRQSNGEWKICPVLPGEWRMDDRLDTCLIDWDESHNKLYLLADYESILGGIKMKLIEW